MKFFLKGLNLQETLFGYKKNKGHHGLKFEEIIYEKYRCTLVHGDELAKGYKMTPAGPNNSQLFEVFIGNEGDPTQKTSTLLSIAESCIYGLGLICVLAAVNKTQKIGDNNYYYHDGKNNFIIDQWWGKLAKAKQIIETNKHVKMKIEFGLSRTNGSIE